MPGLEMAVCLRKGSVMSDDRPLQESNVAGTDQPPVVFRRVGAARHHPSGDCYREHDQPEGVLGERARPFAHHRGQGLPFASSSQSSASARYSSDTAFCENTTTITPAEQGTP